MAIFTDRAIAQIAESVGNHPAERGGALLGPRGYDVVTEFIFDTDGSVTGSSYVPSVNLTKRVNVEEQSQSVELKGIVHSHPGSLDRPSSQDHQSIANLLRANPRMGLALTPVVTRTRSSPDRGHVMDLGASYMNVFVASLLRDGGLDLATEPAVEIRLGKDLQAALSRVGRGVQCTPTSLGEWEGTTVLMAEGAINNRSYMAISSFSYPLVPPVLLRTSERGGTEQVPVAWPLGSTAAANLERAIRGSISRPPRVKKSRGPRIAGRRRIARLLGIS
jgi:proteasome lid subunit RPN8/RPN11